MSLNDMVCPYCHNALSLQDSTIVCQSCNQSYPLIDGIPDFRQSDDYWCNVSRGKMKELNEKSRQSGDWLTTARELIPQYLGAIEPFDRADAQFMWPTTSDSRILDAGSMWGGLTLPVAQHCREIYALDKTIETLAFLKIRAQQMGFTNVHAVASTVHHLPFPDGYFDMVILSGVLEWTAFDQEIVLEDHWGKKRTDSAEYSKDPRQVQVDVLKEMRRVLKPGGHLYLAIENSIGYQYLSGTPDDHVNIRYVSFLPRFLANVITKLKRNCEYRTYTYSLPGYRHLLNEAGFQNSEFYGAFRHYINPSEIVPINLVKYWKKTVLPINNPAAPFHLRMAAKIFPGGLLKYISPTFIALTQTAGGEVPEEARILQLLRKTGLLQGSVSSDMHVVKSKGRRGNYHAANFQIYDNNGEKPVYFCKICRNSQYRNILKDEADNLKTANKLLEGTELSSNIPELLYFGTVDSITFLVTPFLEGSFSGFSPSRSLSKGNLRKLDETIQLAIRFLVKFQTYTKVREIKAIPYLLSIIQKQREILKNKDKLTKEVDSHIKELTKEVKTLEGLTIPICAIHGDYDFYYNILFDRSEVRIVDLEHFESEGLPFLDLATLIFNPILMSYKTPKTDIPLSSFIDRNNLKAYINKWLNLYAGLSGLSMDVLKYFVLIAAMEQQTKEYPYYRDPNTYPMYPEKVFNELLALKAG
ncbi:methyltransferase domain-containing protein [Chloroflexota bacterium]